jgi:ribosomal protein S18 acetylase RimI-like enzyme
MVIRNAEPADFPEIISLINEFSLFQKTPEKVTITLEQLIDDKDIFNCFVAETIDKEIAGFATYFYSYHSWSGKGLYLDDLYVKENFRNLSVGKQLLNTVINFAKDQNCKKVRWVVSNWNLNAIEFYKKIGAAVDTTDLICELTL